MWSLQRIIDTAGWPDLATLRACLNAGGWFPPVFSSFTTKATLEMLKRRAYSAGRFASLAAASPFRTAAITTEGIGLEVRLKKELGQ